MDSEFTPYPDVNEFIGHYRDFVVRDFQANLVGMYLTGSLTYGAFDYDSSDIDLTNVVVHKVSDSELPILRKIHDEMEEIFPSWSKRFECTYTPAGFLSSVLPPKEPRPWYWGGTGQLYPEAVYGNEWIINSYFLHRFGISIYGPEFRQLAQPVEEVEVQKACIRDLFVEWVPKRSDQAWFKDSHHQAYFVLNLCRIVTTVCTGEVCSKPIAAKWVIENHGTRWNELIDAAIKWKYGVAFDRQMEAMAFLDYVVSLIGETDLYKLMEDEIAGLTDQAR